MSNKIIGILGMTFSLVLSVPALADHMHAIKAGNLTIETPWSREMPPGSKVAGGFLKITNTGKEADKLIGGTYTNAQRVEIHEMSMDNGIMRMRELAGGLVIEPGKSVELKPGGYHVMFLDLTKPNVKGDRNKGTLLFEKAGKVEVEYEVRPLGGGMKNMPAH